MTSDEFLQFVLIKTSCCDRDLKAFEMSGQDDIGEDNIKAAYYDEIRAALEKTNILGH